VGDRAYHFETWHWRYMTPQDYRIVFAFLDQHPPPDRYRRFVHVMKRVALWSGIRLTEGQWADLLLIYEIERERVEAQSDWDWIPKLLAMR
jgi:hypothetical protein